MGELFAVDPDLFGDREEFINNVTTLIEKVKATAKLQRVDEIFMPGERGNRMAARIRKTGIIDVEDNHLEELKKVAG